MIKVSVVLPVYNSERYIHQCLNSILNQTLKEIEIICVDDGSTDNSVNLINDICKKDSRVSLIMQKNSYAGVARNNGLKHAKGKYVIFLDSDDFFEPDMLLSMYEKAEEDHAQICLCSGRTFNEKTEEYQYVKYYLNTDFLPEKTPFSAMDIKQRIFNAITPAPWTKLFRRDYILENGFQFQPLKKSNDLLFVFLALACAEKITYVNKPFVNYRTENKNSLQGNTDVFSNDFYTALLSLKKALQKRRLFVEFEQSFVTRALSSCFYNLDKNSNKANYIQIAKDLQNSYLYNLCIFGHTRGYFYIKKDFERLMDFMEKSPDDLWKNRNKTSESIKPKIDINKWICPMDIEYDGNIKISVVIPVYNTENYIGECLDSVIGNTFKDFEIICVNDGSTDNTLNILNFYAERYEKIRVINKENSGPSDTRNIGIEAAKGEYILFIDSDDYIEPRTLEYLYAEAKKDNLDQLYFCAKSFYDNDNIICENLINYYPRKADYKGVMTGREMFIIQSENGEFRPSPCMQFNKRGFLNKNHIRFVSGMIYEDNPFTFQCLSYAKRVRYENIELYNRRLRENSIMTGTQKLRGSYNYFLAIKNMERIAKESNAASDGLFYNAVMRQLERTVSSSCNFVNEVDEKEVLNFIQKLDEETGLDYYLRIVVMGKRIKTAKDLSRKLKDIHEKKLMDLYKEKCSEAERREQEENRREIERKKAEAEAEKKKQYDKTLKGKAVKFLKSALK